MVQGSGFFISSDGTLVTNYHVIKDADSAYIVNSAGKHHPIKGFIAVDPAMDVALLKVDQGDTPFLSLSSQTPAVGSACYALGSPEGLSSTLSDGLISATRQVGNRLLYLQTTAAISHGSSGGPLLNDHGQVVGITSMMITSGQSLNFAVSSAVVRDLLKGKCGQAQGFGRLPQYWIRRALLLGYHQLSYIAALEARIGSFSEAKAFWKRHLSLSKDRTGFLPLYDGAPYSYFLSLASSQANSGFWNDARATAREISPVRLRNDALMTIAAAQVRAGDVKAATETASLASTGLIYRKIAQAIFMTQGLRRAEKFITTRPANDQLSLFLAIADTATTMKDRKAARQLVIKWNHFKGSNDDLSIQNLSVIARLMHLAGREGQASKLLSKARHIADKLGPSTTVNERLNAWMATATSAVGWNTPIFNSSISGRFNSEAQHRVIKSGTAGDPVD